MTFFKVNKILLGVIVMIGTAIFVLESMKSPERARKPVSGVDIPVETAVRNQAGPALSADGSRSADGSTCEAGQCASTDAVVPSGPVNSVHDVRPAAKEGATLPPRIAEKADRYERAKEIMDPHGFINLREGEGSLTLASLVGRKVVLVDFWTYSCINCQRTTPYLNAWYEKYRDRGLEIVGVHTPEFQFEKDIGNVREATDRLGITYPVVLDNAYATWSAYRNRFWPRKYLIDIDGFIVYDHIGEGQYEETEQRIAEALAERADVLGTPYVSDGGTVNPTLTDTPPDSGYLSPETYFGAARNGRLGNGARGRVGEQILRFDSGQALADPRFPQAHALYLAGAWKFTNEYAENTTAGAEIIYRYIARNVYMVASAPPSSPSEVLAKDGVRLKIYRDGKPLGASSAGEDVAFENGEAVVTVREDRLYRLVREGASGEHTLEIRVEAPGLRAFTFTFG